jgi:hypothetical protein
MMTTLRGALKCAGIVGLCLVCLYFGVIMILGPIFYWDPIAADTCTFEFIIGVTIFCCGLYLLGMTVNYLNKFREGKMSS